jgi:hypothetical protein
MNGQPGLIASVVRDHFGSAVPPIQGNSGNPSQ